LVEHTSFLPTLLEERPEPFRAPKETRTSFPIEPLATEKWSDKFRHKMSEIDELNIPRHMKKMGNLIEEIETGSDSIKRFQKECSVVNCSRTFVIMMDARRIRHEGYKKHLQQHNFGRQHRFQDSEEFHPRSTARVRNSIVYPSESIDFPEYSQVKIKQEINLDESSMEMDETSSRNQFKIE
jgi:hypothetical protein